MDWKAGEGGDAIEAGDGLEGEKGVGVHYGQTVRREGRGGGKGRYAQYPV